MPIPQTSLDTYPAWGMYGGLVFRNGLGTAMELCVVKGACFAMC